MQATLVFHVYSIHNKSPVGSFVREFHGSIEELNALLKELAKIKEGFLAYYAILHQMIMGKE